VPITEAPPRPRQLDPDALFAEARSRRRRRRLRLAVLALLVAAAAAGGYAAFGGGGSLFALGGGSSADAARRARAVVILVDVPGSMRASDVKPTRLDATRAALRSFVDRLPRGIEIGVVAFSSSARVVVAPTRDRSLVRDGLRTLEPLAGTALGDGLDAAVAGVVRFGAGRFQNSVPVPPDPQTVAQIARVSGGQAFDATTSATLRAIYSRLAERIGR
jgi:Mg-chelatase subunit ChlD